MKKKDFLRPITTHPRRFLGGLFGFLLLGVLLYYGSRTLLPPREEAQKMVVYAFSTQEEVLSQGIFPAFQEEWRQETGREIILEGIYGPSAVLAGQINLGAPADIAIFSSEEHVQWLKISRLVKPGARGTEIAYTPMVIIVRPGNPYNILDFSDLERPGLRLLHPDPRRSGAGEWAVLAVYGNTLLETRDPRQARKALRAVWDNVRLMAPSARSALTLFELGAGDAMITYEQDALLALSRGVALEIVVPGQTILAQPVAVVIDKNVRREERELARAFMSFLTGEKGQEIFNQYQMRTSKMPPGLFPTLRDPFRIQMIGGWEEAYPGVIESIWKQEIQPQIELDTGINLLENGD